MELREYLLIIRKRLFVILALAFIATLTSIIVSFFVLPEVYEAGTTLYVGKQIDVQSAYIYQDILMGQTLVKDYREIARSKTVCKEVKIELATEGKSNANLEKELRLSDQDFSKAITVSLKNDTRIIEIKVSGVDPTICAIIANKVAFVFKKKVEELLKLDNVQILDQAEAPAQPVKPNKKLNVAAAFFIGIMAGLGLVFAIEYLDNTVKTPEDIVKHTDMNVIGVIPEFNFLDE